MGTPLKNHMLRLNGLCWIVWASTEAALAATTIVRVKADAAVGGDGTSWVNAFTNLQEAIAASPEDSEFWLAAGEYGPFEGALPFAFEFRGFQSSAFGGFAGFESERDQRDWVNNVTTLILRGADGNIASAVVTGARLDGLTIDGKNAGIGSVGCALVNVTVQNCRTPAAMTTWPSPSAASGLHFSNCVFRANTSWHGPAVNLYHSGEVSRCHFLSNTNLGMFETLTALGGALSVSSGRVSNCLFHDNVIKEGPLNGGSLGAGIVCFGDGKLENCTFVGNQSRNLLAYTTRGGGIAIYGKTELANCIFWGNSAATDQDIWVDSGLAGLVTVTHCLVPGGYPGTGNITGPPGFTGPADFRLTVVSPAIDAGTSGPVGLSRDLHDNPRVLDGDRDGSAAADLGCFEFGNYVEALTIHRAARDMVELRFRSPPNVAVPVQAATDLVDEWSTIDQSVSPTGWHQWYAPATGLDPKFFRLIVP